MKTIFNVIKEHPLPAGLFLFNTGIFAWLHTTSTTIVHNLGLQENLADYIPAPIRTFTGENLAAVQAFVGNTGWAWLIFSMIVLVIISFIKGVIKFLFVTAVILIGGYLIYQNQEMIASLLGSK